MKQIVAGGCGENILAAMPAGGSEEVKGMEHVRVHMPLCHHVSHANQLLAHEAHPLIAPCVIQASTQVCLFLVMSTPYVVLPVSC